MEHFLAATCSGKSEGERVAIFMCMISKDGQEVKDTFEFQTAEDGTDIVTTKILFQKFQAYYKPRRDLVIDRHQRETNSLASRYTSSSRNCQLSPHHVSGAN